MDFKVWLKKRENLLLTVLLLLVVLVFTAVRYDYYYDLNDDVLMKDILAGVYTGDPEGHNIQMLWLVSAFISLFYRIVRSVPWYGIFLCVCHFGCLFFLVNRSLSLCRNRKSKVLLLLAELAILLGFVAEHLVCVQYTVTCAMLAMTAVFLFMTVDASLSSRAFVKKSLFPVALIFLAYLIRSEMLLLMLPFIGVAGMIKWGSEKKAFSKENWIKYLSVVCLIFLGLLIGQGSHRLAYGSREWKKFTVFFDNRTELYDFQVLPEYEKNKQFYEAVGLTENERELLDNYNFGLDEEIDEALVGEVAAYAASIRETEKPFLERLLTSIKAYYRRSVYLPTHNESDYPWNYLLLFTYVIVLCTILLDKGESLPQRIWGILWKLVLLFGVRSVLWLWLIMRGRIPTRISHSMYLMEFCVLLGILFMERFKARRNSMVVTCALFFAMGMLVIPQSILKLDENVAEKARNNVDYDVLYSRLKDENHRENFYFMDVYSSVAYTERLFVNVDHSLANYDIMGGWACKSPLQVKKLKAFGIDSMEEALLQREDVFYVQETGADTTWLERYYADHGKYVRLEQIENLKGFEIYRIREKKV